MRLLANSFILLTLLIFVIKSIQLKSHSGSFIIHRLADENFAMILFLIIHHLANVYFLAQKSHSHTYLTLFTSSELVKIPETSLHIL